LDIAGEGRLAAQNVTGRRLDEHHVGAEISKQPGREGP
jgi:hypothetical protein